MEKVVRDVPTMFSEMMILMHINGDLEESRNGNVLTLQEPLTITVKNPKHRVLLDPVRKANPYFHAMEFVWMMSGSQEPDWIQQFNGRFKEYADTNNMVDKPLIHGAYGYRWRNHFGRDQLIAAARMLKEDPTTRRVVLSMWDGSCDLDAHHNDLPCNTHIYFRVVDGKLNMTVCNRSNDVIWGMTGANAVHMTMLQELIAAEADIPIGSYIVFTNNAHVYQDLPNATELLNIRYPILPTDDNYGFYPCVPLISGNEKMADFIEDATYFEAGLVSSRSVLKTQWFREVAYPMYWAYMERKDGGDGSHWVKQIADQNWRTACEKWQEWKA